MIIVGGRQTQIASALLGKHPWQKRACNLWNQNVLEAVFLLRVGEDAALLLASCGSLDFFLSHNVIMSTRMHLVICH